MNASDFILVGKTVPTEFTVSQQTQKKLIISKCLIFSQWLPTTYGLTPTRAEK